MSQGALQQTKFNVPLYTNATADNKVVFGVRLSDDLVLKLLQNPDKATITFGDNNVLTIGSESIFFQRHEESSCDCFFTDAADSTAAWRQTGVIGQKLMLSHELGKGFSDKIKHINEESNKKDRFAVVLGNNGVTAPALPGRKSAPPRTLSRVGSGLGLKRKAAVAGIDQSTAQEISGDAAIGQSQQQPTTFKRAKGPVDVSSAAAESMKLQSKLLHMLAIKPSKWNEVLTQIDMKFENEAKTLLSILAEKRPPGVYHLKKELFKDINLDHPDFTERDRDSVRTQALDRLDPDDPERKRFEKPEEEVMSTASIKDRLIYGSDNESDHSIGNGGSQRRISNVSTSSTSSADSSMTMEREHGASTTTATPPAPAPKRSKPPKPRSLLIDLEGIDLNQTEPYIKPEIRNFTEYKEYRKEFKIKYDFYIRIDQLLKSNAKEFKELGDQYERIQREINSAAATDDKQTVELQQQLDDLKLKLETMYRHRRPEVDSLSRKYKHLHTELTSLKKTIADFVAQNSSTTTTATSARAKQLA